MNDEERDALDQFPFKEINDWLGPRGSLNMLHDCGGRRSLMFCGGAGFKNPFPVEKFVAFVLGLRWEYPENVLIVVQPEEGPTQTFRPAQQAR
jgi:hypothetical protein